MQKFKMTRLAAVLAVAVGLSACGADGTDSGSAGSSSGSGSGGSSGSANILDETQTQASNTITGLAGTLSATPLGGFVQCLDPAVNELLDGPDSLLTNLLKGLNAGLGTQDPTQLADALSAGGGDLAASLQSLTTTLPNALMALAGSTTCSQYGSTSGSSSGSSSSGSSSGAGPTGTPLDQLIALIQGGGATGTPLDALINALPTGGGSSGGGTTGPTGTPLDALLGPLLALQNGGGDQAQIVDQLGIALTDLGTTIAAQNPDAPVVGELVNLLATTVSDLGTVLNQLEQPTTAADLEKTLNDLLTNVNNTLTAPDGLLGTLAANDPTGQFQAPLAGANTQINDAITTVTTQLGSALLQPVAGTGGLTPTLLGALEPLTCALQLTGACTGSSTPSLSTGGSSPLAPLTGALAGTPLAPVTGLLGL